MSNSTSQRSNPSPKEKNIRRRRELIGSLTHMLNLVATKQLSIAARAFDGYAEKAKMRNLDALSREICKRCCNEYYSVVGQWSEYDDDRWKKGVIRCPSRYNDYDGTKMPPERCPYHLEHVMAMQRESV